ncbi:dolichyl-phosphate-mannose--protein mannosyltransferase [Caerostris extrusa]|uniref:Dolichyl-phosphate-mannose--protein mannosyltransferase n=1 Tax=Caerostris extrusa TaxID=172846 RepID=A0AAV4QKB7_CAEEX|nr:dolichyl-phosphate-mannose--protein mannosyltransferase [Caerostris extrusa]
MFINGRTTPVLRASWNFVVPPILHKPQEEFLSYSYPKNMMILTWIEFTTSSAAILSIAVDKTRRLQVLLHKGRQPERTYFNMGMLAMQDRDTASAENYFRKALQLRGDFDAALFQPRPRPVRDPAAPGGRPLSAEAQGHPPEGAHAPGQHLLQRSQELHGCAESKLPH